MNRKYRKTVIAGNWKMNGLPSTTKSFAAELKPLVSHAKWCEIVLCVPAVMVPAAAKAFRDSRVRIGAQDVSVHASGAFTGEVSAEQLADAGAKYVIVGHSERRQYHNESDVLVNQKTHAALTAGLTPIICVGETLAEREMGITMERVALQVKTALVGLLPNQVKQCIFAYEPVWAIGTGKTASADEAGAVCGAIRDCIRKEHGARIARGVTIQYGGSMNEKNAAELLAQADIDGGLIGGASLKPGAFAEIIYTAQQEGATA